MIALVFLLAAQTMAEEPGSEPRSAAFERCMATGDAAQGVTYAMHNCSAAEFQRQDKALNAAYRSRLATLVPRRRAALLGAQRIWIERRDMDCAKAGAKFEGGSFAPIAIDECLTDYTIRRTAWIKRFR